jgi:hypothetical protein
MTEEQAKLIAKVLNRILDRIEMQNMAIINLGLRLQELEDRQH